MANVYLPEKNFEDITFTQSEEFKKFKEECDDERILVLLEYITKLEEECLYLDNKIMLCDMF